MAETKLLPRLTMGTTLENLVESTLFRYVNLMINRGLKEGGCGCPNCYRDAVSITEFYLGFENRDPDIKLKLKEYLPDYETVFDSNFKFVYDRYLRLVQPPKAIDWNEV